MEGKQVGCMYGGRTGEGRKGVGLAGQDRCIISCPTAPLLKRHVMNERKQSGREGEGTRLDCGVLKLLGCWITLV